jgi:DNA-binding NtrC family response regulator
MASANQQASRLNILYGEGDAEVLNLQAGTLQKAGHQVQTATGRKAVEEALSKGPFDLVVLGPTLTKNDRHHLPYMVKKASKTTRVLVMHTDGERHPYVDANLDTGRGIEDVVAKIAAMWPKAEAAVAMAAGK